MMSLEGAEAEGSCFTAANRTSLAMDRFRVALHCRLDAVEDLFSGIAMVSQG
jgi:hypothetical protein